MVIMVTVRIFRLQLTGTPYGDGGQSEGGGVSDLQDICRLGHTIVALAGIQGALVLPPILTGSIRAATEESQVTSVAIY